MDEEEIVKLINVKELRKYTENTITSIEKLREELATVRKQGYAFNKEESENGLRCVSAPIRGYKDKKVIAGISISCPKERYSPEREIEFIKLVLDASEAISSQIRNKEIH
jgi:DNA-binding IclR family transcriptional regulator